jgi:hypothetical protein
MFARSTVPSLIVIGTLHMLTLACALAAAKPTISRASDAARRRSLPDDLLACAARLDGHVARSACSLLGVLRFTALVLPFDLVRFLVVSPPR